MTTAMIVIGGLAVALLICGYLRDRALRRLRRAVRLAAQAHRLPPDPPVPGGVLVDFQEARRHLLAARSDIARVRAAVVTPEPEPDWPINHGGT
jgi:hypothetical protein